METSTFFIGEEKRTFFAKYRQLLRHLYSFLEKEDLRKMKGMIKRVVNEDCYGRDKNGMAC